MYEEFPVKIGADSTETFDVKIFVHNSEDESISRGEYVSEIYSDSAWQDSWNYLKATFPEQKEYLIRVTEDFGLLKICARLRKTDSQTTHLSCSSIFVEEVEKPVEEAISEEKVEEDSEVKEASEIPVPNESSEQLGVKAEIPQNSEKIFLSSKPEQKQVGEIISKTEKSRKIFGYFFIFLLVLTLILLVLKKM